MKKKSGVHVIPNPPSKPDVKVTSEAWMQRIGPVLQGKEPAPNKFVEYLAKQAVAADQERMDLLNRLKDAENQIGQMRERVVSLDGQVKARIGDIKAWWDSNTEAIPAKTQPFIVQPESEEDHAGSVDSPTPEV